jgi:hypothetical protein
LKNEAEGSADFFDIDASVEEIDVTGSVDNSQSSSRRRVKKK